MLHTVVLVENRLDTQDSKQNIKITDRSLL